MNELVSEVKKRLCHMLKQQLDSLTIHCGDVNLNGSKDRCLIGMIFPTSEDMITWVVKSNTSSSTAIAVYNQDEIFPSTSSNMTSTNNSTYNLETEKSLPGFVMASGGQVFAMLYQLATIYVDNTDKQMINGIRRLIHLIPTDPTINEALESISYYSSPMAAASASSAGDAASPKLSPRSQSKVASSSSSNLEEAKSQLAKLFDAGAEGMSPFRVLYNLEVLSGKLMPTKSELLPQAQQFSHDFLNVGGLRLIFNVLERDALPMDIDYDIRQSAYLVALQLSAYLLCGYTVVRNQFPSLPSASPGTVKPTPPKKSALESSSSSAADLIKSPITVSASKIVQTMLESEFGDTVSCLMRVVWAAAAGKLHLASSSISSDSPNNNGENSRFYLGRRSRDSSTGSSGSESAAGDSTAVVLHAGVCSQQAKVSNIDVQIAGEAFELLVSCLTLRSNNVSCFYNLPLIHDFIIDTVLGSSSEQVRQKAADQLIRLSKIGAPPSLRRHLNFDDLTAKSDNSTAVLTPKQFLTKTILKTPVPLWMPSCKARGISHSILANCTEYFQLRWRFGFGVDAKRTKGTR